MGQKRGMHITFDLSDERQAKAYNALLAASTERTRSEFIVDCILQDGDNAAFAKMVADCVLEQLKPMTLKGPRRGRGRPRKYPLDETGKEIPRSAPGE